MFEYVNRGESYHLAVQLLHRIFCPGGRWDGDNFDDLLVELQQASLINFCTEEKKILTLSIHPLVRAWAQDRLQSEDTTVFRNAMARVLACGAAPPGADLHERMISHINAMKPHWDQLHINELTSFAVLLAFPGIADDSVMIWERALKEVKEIHGNSSEITLEVTRKLKDMYVIQGDEKRAAMIQEEITFNSPGYVPTDSASFIVTTPTTPTIAPIANVALPATVKRTFTPSRPDELSILIGERVRVIIDYDDGWALCEKTATGEQGVIPQECLDRQMKDSTVSDSSQNVHIVQGESRPVGTRSSSIIHEDKDHPSSGHNENFGPSRTETNPSEREAGPGIGISGLLHHIRRDEESIVNQTAKHPNAEFDAADLAIRIKVVQEISTDGGGDASETSLVTMSTTWWAQTLQSMSREVESRISSYGVYNTLTIDSLTSLATHLEMGRRFDAAEGLRRSILEGRRLIELKMSPKVVLALDSLASNYQSQERYRDAIPLLEEMVELLRANKERKRTLLHAMERLARCYEQLEMVEETETKRAEILLLRREMGSEENPNKVYHAVEKLASCYEEQGKYLQAIDLLRELLETRSRLFGPMKECSVSTAERLALALEAVGHFEMAQPLREALLCLYEHNESELSSSISTTIESLALNYALQGTPNQSIALLERYAYTPNLLRRLPLNDQRSLKGLLARFYEKAGLIKKAQLLLLERLDSEALDLETKISSLKHLTVIHGTQEKRDEARNLQAAVQNTKQRYFGPDDFTTPSTIGQLPMSQGRIDHGNPAMPMQEPRQLPAQSGQSDESAGANDIRATLDAQSASRTMYVGRMWSQYVISITDPPQPPQPSQPARAPTILSQFRNVVRSSKKQEKL
ncbi:hypothetical protein FS842_002723 [Serendipita sp. 407]|nr:hypothetical protein FS842_002723 [Serendipita sp. 407]